MRFASLSCAGDVIFASLSQEFSQLPLQRSELRSAINVIKAQAFQLLFLDELPFARGFIRAAVPENLWRFV